MSDTDPEPTDLDHFVLRECGVIVKIALCDVRLSPDRGETLNPLDGLVKSSSIFVAYLFRPDIPAANHVLCNARTEKLSKLVGDLHCTLRNVKVTEDQHQLHKSKLRSLSCSRVCV